MIEIAGTPRSLAELDFVAGTRPCEGCGDWRPVAWKTGGRGALWTVRATCLRCATERIYAFACDRDLVEMDHDDLELGGPEPSDVLEPCDLVREIDRLVPTIVLEPARLVDPAWSANEAVVDRVRTALGELAKFIPAGAVAIPASRHRSVSGRVDQRARPERYTRAWIVDERARWDAVAAAIVADAPRMFAADRMISRVTPRRGRLDGAAFAAHREWLERAGNGRLDVVTADARGLALPGADLAGCRLEGVVLVGADLVRARFDHSELIDVDLQDARLEAASFVDAALTGCTFEDAAAGLATFERARLASCSLARASLPRSRWRGATLEATTLRGAVLAGAELGVARLVGCDLRGVSLAGASCAGAMFERCDLRGVDFTGCDLSGVALVACAVDGARGVPSSIAGWAVEASDFSAAADGSELGDAADLLDELGG